LRIVFDDEDPLPRRRRHEVILKYSFHP
jgi:hypothetical protein